MLSGGPLSGQMVTVYEDAKEYKIVERTGHPLKGDGEYTTTPKSYKKSDNRFGELQIFIWEDDIPTPKKEINPFIVR